MRATVAADALACPSLPVRQAGGRRVRALVFLLPY